MPKKVAIPKRNYRRKIQSYVLFTVVIVVGFVVYGFFELQKLTAAQVALAQGVATSEQLSSSVGSFSDSYLESKNIFDEGFASILNSVEGVFPTEEDYTDLTRLLDDFVQKNNTSLNPLIMDNISYGAARTIEDNHSILPVTTTINASRENFENFLRFIFNSGALQERTRLMDIQAISINFSQISQGLATTIGPEQSLLNVSIQLNAYFQAPTKSAPGTAT